MPNDDFGGERGIELIECGHKLNSEIINLCMTNYVSFYEEIHGSRRRRWTFAAIRETKLRMQMNTCKSETLHEVCLYLRKAYDSIDRNRVMHLLERYKVGPVLRNYIKAVWDE